MRENRKEEIMSEKIEHTGRDEERRRLLLVAVLLIVVQVIIVCVAYPLVPAQMPLHWNALGQVNGYGSKLEALCFPPVMSLFVLLLVRGLLALGPYPGQENKRVATQFTDYVITAVIVLMLLIQLSIIAISLHVPIDIISIISIAISLLLIGIGNYMGKLRRNFYAGIRTPWTISDDTVWERTHRLGGWLFVAAGVIGLITAFIPSAPIKLAGLLAPILLAGVISVVYSYIEYQKLHAKSF
jgi:uncharacterized membrane protein